jgi:hypothetical protein
LERVNRFCIVKTSARRQVGEEIDQLEVRFRDESRAGELTIIR